MTKQDIILIGAGGHALSCIDVIEQAKNFKIAGLVGLKEEIGTVINGYKVIGSDSDLAQIVRDYKFALITVGQIRNADLRIKLFTEAIKVGFELPIIISPYSYISPHAQIDKGTIVLHGAVINAGVKIGNNCIINSCVLIEHGTEVSDHCHVSTGAILNGDTHIGARSFIGSGAILKQGISIGTDCQVGMGQLVTKDLDNLTKLTENTQL
jgi:sugar O-acyltransferase (sialic acid O-acetyltransferase NeuD family)